MTGLEALQSAGFTLLRTHGESFTLYATGGPVVFTAIRRQRYRNIPETGGVATELTLLCRRDVFGIVRPLSGHEVGAAGDRWRVALIQPGEMPGWIEIVLDGDQP